MGMTGRTKKLSAVIGVVWGLMARLTFALQVQVEWDPPSSNTDGSPATGVAGYKVRYGTASRNYGIVLDAGNSLKTALQDLREGVTYYIVVSAYDSGKVEGDFSPELAWTAPDRTPPQIVPPAPQILKASTNGWATLPDWCPLVSVTDNCSDTANIVVSQTPAPQTPLRAGAATVTILARD